MKKTWIVLAVIAVLLLLVYSSITGSYNSMVSMREEVTAQWQMVETTYQSRADKTKNLVEIVKGAANFEKETLTQVMEARSKATSITLSGDDLTPEKLAAFQKAQAGFGSALGRLMAVAENYPQLQAVGAFRDFQAQYEGMENRISVARMKYNESAQNYNTFIQKFPKNIFAGIFGFEKKAYFEAENGAEKAPQVQF